MSHIKSRMHKFKANKHNKRAMVTQDPEVTVNCTIPNQSEEDHKTDDNYDYENDRFESPERF